MAVRQFGPAWRIADGIFLLLFAFSVVVQVNDPDPFRWIAIYSVAALACMMAEHLHWTVFALIGIVALAWAATFAPDIIGRVPFLSMFEEFEMKSKDVEESREMYGLLLVAFWMSMLSYRAFVRSQRSRG